MESTIFIIAVLSAIGSVVYCLIKQMNKDINPNSKRRGIKK